MKKTFVCLLALVALAGCTTFQVGQALKKVDKVYTKAKKILTSPEVEPLVFKE